MAIDVTPEGENGLSLSDSSEVFHRIPVGRWAKVIETLHRERVTQVYLFGKVSKDVIFANGGLDERFRFVVESLPQKNDDAVVLAFIRDLEREGIGVLPQTNLIPELVPSAGCLSSRIPSESEFRDIRYGYHVAGHIAGLDIGQTVVLRNGVVLAIEAIEGTDQAILRGGALGRGRGAVVVKVSKPHQDFRFDVPTVGVATIRSMAAVGATTLAVDAGRSFMVEREEAVRLADDADIAVWAEEVGPG